MFALLYQKQMKKKKIKTPCQSLQSQLALNKALKNRRKIDILGFTSKS